MPKGKIIKEFDSEVDVVYTDLLGHNMIGQMDLSALDPVNPLYYEVADRELQEVRIVPIKYHGTMDRIVVDRYNRWWILDYKTAKGADTKKLETDDQISAYVWAAQKHYQHPIYGFIYLQLTKDVAKPPKRLKNGQLSVDKKQRTTYKLFRDEVIKEYGAMAKVPNKYIELLNTLASMEEPEGDRFIRWDFVHRNEEQVKHTFSNIIGEAQLMLDMNLYLFPNPTRDCGWDCPYREICIATEQGRVEDVKAALASEFTVREDNVEHNREEWKEHLVYPDSPLAPASVDEVSLKPKNIFNIVLPDEYYSNSDDED
jgi:hypothetical protein